MNWYMHVLTNYAAFAGRARRAEFWYFALFNLIIALVLYFVSSMVLKNQLLYTVYSLATLIPSLAVTVRRLHDTGRSGWWWFIALVPIVGWIVLLVFCAMEGTHGENQYGPDPKAAGATTVPA